MANRVKALADTRKHYTNDEKKQHIKAESALYNYPELKEEAPEWLTGNALKEWQHLTPYLKANAPISDMDTGLLASYCTLYATIQDTQSDINRLGTTYTDEATGTLKTNPAVRVQLQAIKDLKSVAGDLGLSISSRARLELNKAQNEKPSDPFKELLK